MAETTKTRFFKSWVPRAGIGIRATGKVITWETLDHRTGYLSTSDEFTIAELDDCVKGERYGVVNIDEAEYTKDYASKKNPLVELRPPWREELSAGSYAPDTVGAGITPTPFTSPLQAPAAPAGTDVPAPPYTVAPESKTARKGSV